MGKISKRGKEMSTVQKEQLDVWLMQAPYSDYSEGKIRPIIIISNNAYNQELFDFLGVHITTRKEHPYAIKISDTDFSVGGLNRESIVRFDTVTRYEERLLVKKIGRIKREFYQKIYDKILWLIKWQ